MFIITYRDGNGNTYTDRTTDLEVSLETLRREQPRATVVCVDRVGGKV